MFKNCICNSIYENRRLFEYVRTVYITILELEIEHLKICESDESIIEALENTFPRSFLQRNPQKAKQIIYDLDDIVRSDNVREAIPPIHCYTMYQLLCDYSDYFNDVDKNIIFSEEKKYLFETYPEDLAEEYFEWIDWLPDDFVDQYDDSYIWLDLWEHHFLYILDNPSMFYTNSEIEQMLELMPNDIIHRWTIAKENYDDNAIPINIHSNIMMFKDYIEGTAYEVFRVADTPNEELCRTLLQTFLIPRGFREAHMAGGRCDLIYPEHNIIIETKIWRGEKYFEDGILELKEYLKSQKYRTGYYIVFDNTKKQNAVVKKYKSEVFDIEDDNYLIRCVFITINPIAPSIKNKYIKNMIR